MQTIDVRTIVPRERHPLIFKLGETFQWQYLEQGPEVWKVRIGRPS